MLTILFQILQASIVYMCVFLCDLLWPKKQLTRFGIQYGLKVHVSKGNNRLQMNSPSSNMEWETG